MAIGVVVNVIDPAHAFAYITAVSTVGFAAVGVGYMVWNRTAGALADREV